MNKLIKENIPHKSILFMGIFLDIASAISMLIIPYMISQIFDARIIKSVMKHPMILFLIVMGIIVIYVVQAVADFLLGKAGAQSMESLQNQFSNHVLLLRMKDIEQFQSGDIASRLTNDIGQVAQLVTTTIPKMLTNLLMVIGAIIILIRINWKLSLMLIVSVSLLVFIAVPVNKKIEQLYVEHQDVIGKINAKFNQKVQNIVVIKAFLGEKQEVDKNKDTLHELYKNIVSLTKTTTIYNTSLNALIMIFIILIVCIANYVVVDQHFAADMLVAYVLYALQAITPLVDVFSSLSEVFETKGALKRVNAIFDKPIESIKDDKLELQASNIVLNNVTFAFDDTTILNDVSLEAKAHQITAIVGPSGAGKTTIFLLLLKFFTNYDGKICIGNRNLQDISLGEIRRMISVVFQNNLVFRGTLLDNLKYGKNKNIPDSVVKQIIKKIGLTKLYDTYIEENGNNLSGGQKQKVNIARGLLSSGKFLLLDEVTSSLDSESEKRVLALLENRKKDSTILVIAHKLNTIRNADKIYVLEENGRISGSGTHSELLETNDTYRKYYYDLLNSEE